MPLHSFLEFFVPAKSFSWLRREERKTRRSDVLPIFPDVSVELEDAAEQVSIQITEDYFQLGNQSGNRLSRPFFSPKQHVHPGKSRSQRKSLIFQPL